MKYLLDTCAVSDFFKKNEATVQHFQSKSPNHIYLSTLSLMEIEYGLCLNDIREKKIRPLWNSLTNQINTIPFTESCALAAAKLRANLKSKGQLIGPYDILLAGCALANEFILVTSNVSEFSRIPDLRLEDWRQPQLNEA